MNFNSNPPLGLYIHLPWCERKCPYCDFNSHAVEDIDEYTYIDALIDDLQQDLPLIWGRQINSIFIGGGTPSLFSAKAIDLLLSSIRSLLNFNPAIEITLEANPGSAEADRLEGYRQAGVNRLSLGIQSFNNDCLQSIGRVHNGQQALNAFNKARQAGFDNINLDLMYALPDQSVSQLMDDINQAIDLDPEHISLYQLTIEPNTLFYSQLPDRLPDDEISWTMQQQAQLSLSTAGYRQYEISAYARSNHQSRHNMNYWQFGDYLGIGAGAHGKITLPASQGIIRRNRIRHPKNYMETKGEAKISEQRSLNEQDVVFEFMLNALRLTEGFNRSLFNRHCGLPDHLLDVAVDTAVEQQLLESRQGHLQPTALGLRFHNDLQALFLDVDCNQSTTIEPTTRF